jgi:hypothetical protein
MIGWSVLEGVGAVLDRYRLGWATSVAGRDLYVRQLRDMEYPFSPAGASPADLERDAISCGWVLARAHATAEDAATIAGYLGSDPGSTTRSCRTSAAATGRRRGRPGTG